MSLLVPPCDRDGSRLRIRGKVSVTDPHHYASGAVRFVRSIFWDGRTETWKVVLSPAIQLPDFVPVTAAEQAAALGCHQLKVLP